MDFLKKAQESVGGNSNSNTANTTGGSAPVEGQTANAGTQDYGDKGSSSLLLSLPSYMITLRQRLIIKTAFAFASKKSGQNMDANTSEKITDGARGMYEKATG
jgi:hypothetical protein